MKSKKTLDWLLEKDQPSIRYIALEAVGEPSKIITLRAMQVLERLGE
ncbi:MAG: hypothetical protein LYZ69_04910 [Nitrososphaerales archaeon]|nr:hypothetical protein [Nitrososphaerales archaeon]